MASPLQKILVYLVLTLKFLLLSEEKQLSHREVELSKQSSLVKIYVERVIGLMKKYLILKEPLLICLLKHKEDTVAIV